MNIIKRHKGLAIVSALTLVLLIVIGAIFSKMLFSSKKGEYGDRLDGVEEIKESALKEVETSISEHDEVEEVKIRTQGKIVYTNIVFGEDVSLSKAKEIAEKSLEKYEEDVVEVYDFEFLLSQKVKEVENDEGEVESKKGFAAAGTKHPEHDYISWTRS